MKRKKRGNSLIMVVITCMFVTAISAAMLSMVAGNYKARVVESKRVENLYATDSGLDVAYNIIGKTFDAAAKYGNLKVEKLKSLTKDSTDDGTSPNNAAYIQAKQDIYHWQHINDGKSDTDSKVSQKEINKNIEEDNKKCEDLVNSEFKRAFKNFILPNNDPKEINKEKPLENSLRDYIEKREYVNKVTKNDNGDYDYEIAAVKFLNDNTHPELWIPKPGTANPENTDGSKETKDGLVYDSNDEKYILTVKSNFKTSTSNSGVVGENSRIIQTNYVMKVPEYGDIFYNQKSGDLHEYLAINDERALTIGGNMIVNGSNNLKVDGNIFVNGVDPAVDQNGIHATLNLDNRTYEKYRGGISINDSSNVILGKDVITRNTFNIADNAEVTVKNNLYGGNVYMGNIAEGDNGFARESKLTVSNSVIIDNDLAVKAKNESNITINDFYGINDKNINSNGGNFIAEDSLSKVKNSSSIIVNGVDDSTKVNITKSAYIMGTAHIDTIGDKDGYQTGESGAVNNGVKKNYMAYSVPLNEAEKLDYYEPLQLLDDSNVFNKAEHFGKYWDPNQSNGEAKKTTEKPDTGGIIWPAKSDGSVNVWSIGAIVYKNGNDTKVLRSNYKPELEAPNGEIYNKRAEFAGKVYRFGQAPKIEDYNNSNMISFSSIMDLSKIPSDYEGIDNQAAKGEYAIFNPKYSTTGKAKAINITKYNGSQDEIDDSGNTIEIKVASKGSDGYKLNAVIATDGNVNIEDDINLVGSIIAKGNLNISGNNINIEYNKDVIDRIQAENYNTFKEVFGEGMLDNASDTSEATNGLSVDSNFSYDIKKFLENTLWKIIK
ncbi:hypothetical protein [Clostridium saccharoperbutylacetonicum]